MARYFSLFNVQTYAGDTKNFKRYETLVPFESSCSQPIYIPITRLGAHVETVQLPYDLGGTKFHDHSRWTQTRMVKATNFTILLSSIQLCRNLFCFVFNPTDYTAQKVEVYEKSSEILVAKIVYLRGKLCSFDPLRSRDRAEVDLGSYWEAGTELAENAQEVLISGVANEQKRTKTPLAFHRKINRFINCRSKSFECDEQRILSRLFGHCAKHQQDSRHDRVGTGIVIEDFKNN